MLKRFPAILLVFWVLFAPACGVSQIQQITSLPGYGTPGQRPPADPELLVTLSRPIYRIKIDPHTGEPQMPKDVIATAQPLRWPAGVPCPTAFIWRVYLDWDSPVYPTHHDIRNRTFTQPSPLQIDFGDQIRGGTLTVFARTSFNGRVVFGKAHALVLGENPSREMILRVFPRNRFGLIASKICMAESGMDHFTPASGTDPGGLPIVSRTKDIGLMQLNAPSGGISSADQVWDWRANVRQGLEILEGKRRTTMLASRSAVSSARALPTGLEPLAYLNFLRAFVGLKPLSPPSIDPLSDRPGTGEASGDPDVDHLHLSQFEREAIRRYNGGSEYAYGITFNPHTLTLLTAGWVIDPTRGGMAPGHGDPDYVRHVLSAHSGLTLPPPPSHSKKTPSHSRHSHHSRRRRRRIR